MWDNLDVNIFQILCCSHSLSCACYCKMTQSQVLMLQLQLQIYNSVLCRSLVVFFNVVYIFRSNVKWYWYIWGEGTDKPCQVGSLEEKIPNQTGQCVPSSCLIAIKECICLSSLTVLDICIYVMCVSQLPSCFSRSATESKVSEQQNHYFNVTWNAYNCLWDKMEESVYTITSVTLQIRYAFASHPPKDAVGSSYLTKL